MNLQICDSGENRLPGLKRRRILQAMNATLTRINNSAFEFALFAPSASAVTDLCWTVKTICVVCSRQGTENNNLEANHGTVKVRITQNHPEVANVNRHLSSMQRFTGG